MRSCIITIIKKDTIQISTQSFGSQKTSISHGNLHIGNWCKRKSSSLERISYIYYLVQFKKDKTQVQALINLKSKVNAIYPIFVKELGFFIRPIDVGM